MVRIRVKMEGFVGTEERLATNVRVLMTTREQTAKLVSIKTQPF